MEALKSFLMLIVCLAFGLAFLGGIIYAGLSGITR